MTFAHSCKRQASVWYRQLSLRTTAIYLITLSCLIGWCRHYVTMKMDGQRYDLVDVLLLQITKVR
jgi:hypothetical protein